MSRKRRLERHKNFVKDFKRVSVTDNQFERLMVGITKLLHFENLPEEFKDHPLRHDLEGFREFHLGGDMLVMYHLSDEILTLARIGTHNDLFNG